MNIRESMEQRERESQSSQSLLSRYPSFTKASRSIKYGFPAKVEKDWYGESPYPVGPRGRICQYFCPALASWSTNSYASSEKHPIPYFDGRLDTGSKIPLALIIYESSCFLSSCALSQMSAGALWSLLYHSATERSKSFFVDIYKYIMINLLPFFLIENLVAHSRI